MAFGFTLLISNFCKGTFCEGIPGLLYTHVQDCCTRTGLLHTYRIATHVQDCYTRTGLLHTYRIATHVQDCYTRTGLLHTYRIATHVQDYYTRTGLLHTYMIATHVQDCYYNNTYKDAGICPYTESTNTFKIKHSST